MILQVLQHDSIFDKEWIKVPVIAVNYLDVFYILHILYI